MELVLRKPLRRFEAALIFIQGYFHELRPSQFQTYSMLNIRLPLQAKCLNPRKVTLASVLIKGEGSPYKQDVALQRQLPIPNLNRRIFIP